MYVVSLEGDQGERVVEIYSQSEEKFSEILSGLK